MTDTKRSNSGLWIVRRAWRDFVSVYYANTPTWRWLKSGALVFLGFFAWTTGAVLLSVRPEWGLLSYVIAYGFLLLVWGPFTHFVVVPVTIRLRRTAEHPLVRGFSRHSGKINLTVFFTLVVVFGAFSPGIMMLEFAPLPGDGKSAQVSGDLVCEEHEEVIACRVENPRGVDHVAVTSGGEELTRAEESPFAFEIRKENIEETRTGKEFVVDYRDADGATVRRQVRVI